MLLPLFMSSYNMVYGSGNHMCDDTNGSFSDFLNAGSFLGVAILNTTLAFFRFSEYNQLHSTYERFYMDIKSDIETELIKDRPYRNQVDVFVSKVQSRFDYTNADAPDFPPSFCCLLNCIK